MRLIGIASSAALLLGLGACRSAPPTLYDWGRYEDCVYEVCTNPDGYDRPAQIDLLERQLEETESTGRDAPPGLRAHLAMLLSQDGQIDRAVLLLRGEMEHFPESRVFYLGMLTRMGVGDAEATAGLEEGGEAGPTEDGR